MARGTRMGLPAMVPPDRRGSSCAVLTAGGGGDRVAVRGRFSGPRHLPEARGVQCSSAGDSSSSSPRNRPREGPGADRERRSTIGAREEDADRLVGRLTERLVYLQRQPRLRRRLKRLVIFLTALIVVAGGALLAWQLVSFWPPW